ncbi:hypothetical protein [Veronia nyctiphanis]|uniref:hypothetical protein n=1 Tax=Veronia nyctiphanis TaxID=1278244 RepID=UPI001F229AE5|nr:hypothetical protein [Veronia nyctiphanis]
MTMTHTQIRYWTDKHSAWRKTLKRPTVATLRSNLNELFSPALNVHMCHPFGDLLGPENWIEHCFIPLMRAIPDLERRDTICIVGSAITQRIQ